MPRRGRVRAGSTGQPCSPLYEPHSRGVREKGRSSNSRGPTARSKRPQPMVPAPLSAGPRNAGMADSQARPPLRCSKKVGLAMAPGDGLLRADELRPTVQTKTCSSHDPRGSGIPHHIHHHPTALQRPPPFRIGRQRRRRRPADSLAGRYLKCPQRCAISRRGRGVPACFSRSTPPHVG